MPLWYLQERLANILGHSICEKLLEVTQYTVTVANIGYTRSAVTLRVDCKTIRVIDAEIAQVKLEFMMATSRRCYS